MGLEEYEQEIIFKEKYESYGNGNIADFKSYLGSLKGDEIFNFILWLQSEGLEL
jgi:hypothetical protein